MPHIEGGHAAVTMAGAALPSPSTRRRAASRRSFVIIATLLLAVPMLLVPAGVAEARSSIPRVAVRGAAVPGRVVTLVGSGFRPGGILQVRWDSSRHRTRLIWVNHRGGFTARVRIPITAAAGTHTLTLGRPRIGMVLVNRRSTRIVAQKVVIRVPIRVGAAPTATPAPTPTPAPVTSGSVRVTSIAALLDALANDGVTDIVVANGTYHVSAAGLQRSDSLWIGARFAARTQPVTVRAETAGGVTFDGGGAAYFGCMWFVDGAHDQTWDGFTCARGTPTQTGVVMFGDGTGRAAPHDITLRDLTIPRSVVSSSAGATDHAIYFSQAVGGPHDLLIDGLKVDGGGGIDTALHFYHSDATNQNAWNVTVRNMQVIGTAQAVMLWDPTLRNIVIEDSTISGASKYAISYEKGGTVTLRRVTSTGSGEAGFYSSLGTSPAGVTFSDCSLR